jgi:hypothetical protein
MAACVTIHMVASLDGLDKDVVLHLVEAKAYASGMVALRYQVRKQGQATGVQS